MKALLVVCLAALLLTHSQAQPQTNLYVLGWSSAFPVQISRVEVRSGALVQVLMDGSHTSGTIAAESGRACVTIEAWGETSTGALVHFARAWDAECERVWVPLMLSRE